MPIVQMPDGTQVEMPDSLDEGTGKRLRAFLDSQSKAPAEAIPEGEGDYRSRAEAGSKARLRQRQVYANAPGVSELETYGVAPGDKIEPAMSGPRMFAERAAAGIADIPAGLVQFGANVTGLGADTVNRVMSEREQTIEQARMQNARAQIARLISTPEFQQLAKDAPGQAQSQINALLPGVDLSRLMGGMVVPGIAGAKAAKLMSPTVSRLPTAMRIPANAAMGAAGGGLTAAVTPEEVSSREEYAQTKKEATPTAAAIGAAIPIVGSAVRRVANPTMPQSVATLRAAGVDVPIGSAVGGFAKTAETVLSKIPLLGYPIRAADKRALAQTRAAAINDTLGEFGEKLPASLGGRDAVEYMQDTVSQKYGEILQKIPPQRIDGKLAEDINSAIAGLGDRQPEVADEVRKFLNFHIVRLANANGDMLDGRAFKDIESTLTKEARRITNSSASSANDMAKAFALNDVRAALRNWLERKAPEQAPELQRVNRAYAKSQIINDAATRIRAIGGEFDARDLGMSVKKEGGTKSQVAAGKGRLQELSDAAQERLRTSNDGTMIGGVGEGVAAVNSGLTSLAGVLGTGALYSRPGQRAATALIFDRPEGVRTIGELLGRNIRDAGGTAGGTIEREKRREKK